MKVFYIECAVFAIFCGLTILTFNTAVRNKQKKKKIRRIKGNELKPRAQSELQNTEENVLLGCGRNNLTIHQLPVPRWVKVGKVTHLHAYPLVSGKPCAADECEVKFEGMYMFNNNRLINWDRAFVVYNAETRCIITGNNFPTLHEVSLLIENDYIILQAVQMPTLSIKLKDNEIIECTYWYCKKTRQIPKIVCTDCGDDAARWLSRFLWGKDCGLRLGYAINAVGCMGIYWQLVLRNCLLYQKTRRNKYNLKPFVDTLHSVLISPIPYNNTSEVLKIFESDEVICPNIVVLISNFYLEEKWEWIKIGNVIIRNTQPLIELRDSMIGDIKLFGLGVNCELYLLGRVKLGDNVYLHIPNGNLIMENETSKQTNRFS